MIMVKQILKNGYELENGTILNNDNLTDGIYTKGYNKYKNETIKSFFLPVCCGSHEKIRIIGFNIF